MIKTKRISIRITKNVYLDLKNDYARQKIWDKNKHKSFSDYIKYLLVLGLNEYY